MARYDPYGLVNIKAQLDLLGTALKMHREDAGVILNRAQAGSQKATAAVIIHGDLDDAIDSISDASSAIGNVISEIEKAV